MSIKKPLHNISTTINNKTSIILIPNREHKQTNKQTNKQTKKNTHSSIYVSCVRDILRIEFNISDMMNDNIITIDKYVL